MRQAILYSHDVPYIYTWYLFFPWGIFLLQLFSSQTYPVATDSNILDMSY